MEIRDYCTGEKETLTDENKRLLNAQPVHVGLSYPLWDLKNKMIDEARKEKGNYKVLNKRGVSYES